MKTIKTAGGASDIETGAAGCDCPECDCEPGCKCGRCACCE